MWLNCSKPANQKNMRLSARLMELSRELGIEDHTKVIFHLKILREAGMVEHDKGKSYKLTKDGEKTMNCLKLLETHLSPL